MQALVHPYAKMFIYTNLVLHAPGTRMTLCSFPKYSKKVQVCDKCGLSTIASYDSKLITTKHMAVNILKRLPTASVFLVIKDNRASRNNVMLLQKAN